MKSKRNVKIELINDSISVNMRDFGAASTDSIYDNFGVWIGTGKASIGKRLRRDTFIAVINTDNDPSLRLRLSLDKNAWDTLNEFVKIEPGLTRSNLLLSIVQMFMVELSPDEFLNFLYHVQSQGFLTGYREAQSVTAEKLNDILNPRTRGIMDASERLPENNLSKPFDSREW
jgi:hypothetical protein